VLGSAEHVLVVIVPYVNEGVVRVGEEAAAPALGGGSQATPLPKHFLYLFFLKKKLSFFF
jgi:hypothetical protein